MRSGKKIHERFVSGDCTGVRAGVTRSVVEVDIFVGDVKRSFCIYGSKKLGE